MNEILGKTFGIMQTKKILVIDDEEGLRELINIALTEKGYEVIDADSGQAGMEKAEAILPDLILCDLNLPPGLNGRGILSSLRDKPDTRGIPFILMTGGTDQMREVMNLGADDYLAKPFTLDILCDAVDIRLKKAQELKDKADLHLRNLAENINMMLPHELRTPLNGILAYADLLKSSAESLPAEEIADMGATICESGLRLQRLIENFLIHSQIQLMNSDPARASALRKKQTPLPGQVVDECCAAQAEEAGRKEDLVLKLVDKPASISDEYLSKIVSELVMNAFKFSRPGTPVEVCLYPLASELVLQIKDQGKGISPQQIRDLGVFMQFDRKQNEQQGLGFGLIISKQLTELHNGTFEIKSDPHRGTNITATFPLAGLN